MKQESHNTLPPLLRLLPLRLPYHINSSPQDLTNSTFCFLPHSPRYGSVKWAMQEESVLHNICDPTFSEIYYLSREHCSCSEKLWWAPHRSVKISKVTLSETQSEERSHGSSVKVMLSYVCKYFGKTKRKKPVVSFLDTINWCFTLCLSLLNDIPRTHESQSI